MKSMTIRGIDPELDKALKTKAAECQSSVNQLVIDALKAHFGLQKPQKYTKRYHDLDELFGCWDEGTFQQMETALQEQRQIDPELWS
jgi:ribosomal protein S24E